MRDEGVNAAVLTVVRRPAPADNIYNGYTLFFTMNVLVYTFVLVVCLCISRAQ